MYRDSRDKAGWRGQGQFLEGLNRGGEKQQHHVGFELERDLSGAPFLRRWGLGLFCRV